jgi:hypothetical protein
MMKLHWWRHHGQTSVKITVSSEDVEDVGDGGRDSWVKNHGVFTSKSKRTYTQLNNRMVYQGSRTHTHMFSIQTKDRIMVTQKLCNLLINCSLSNSSLFTSTIKVKLQNNQSVSSWLKYVHCTLFLYDFLMESSWLLMDEVYAPKSCTHTYKSENQLYIILRESLCKWI